MEEQERTEIERAVFVDIKEHFRALHAGDERRLDERFEALDKALTLQAAEYERRLENLNGEYQRDRQRQAGFVSLDKWETTNESEKVARETALLRVNEKFEDAIKNLNGQLSEYIKRYELERREIDLRLAAQSGAAEEAKRAVEEAVRKSDAQSRDLARKQSRNLGLASLALGVFVFAANFLPDILK